MTQEELYEALKSGDEERTRLMAVQTEIMRANGEMMVQFMNMFAAAQPSQEPAEKTEKQENDRLRDYFAANALHGICSHPDTWGLQDDGIADRAYHLADLMLAERAK